MKNHLITLFLCLQFLAVNNICAGEVTARYADADKTKLSITNNTDNPIVIFKEVKITPNANNKSTFQGYTVSPSINVKQMKTFTCLIQQYVKLLSNQTFTYPIDFKCKTNGFFYYSMIISDRIVVEGKTVEILPFEKKESKPAVQAPVAKPTPAPVAAPAIPVKQPPVQSTPVVQNKPQEVPEQPVAAKHVPAPEPEKRTVVNTPPKKDPNREEQERIKREREKEIEAEKQLKEYEWNFAGLNNYTKSLLKSKITLEIIDKLKEEQTALTALKNQAEKLDTKQRSRKKGIIDNINDLNAVISQYVLGKTADAIVTDYLDNIFKNYNDTVTVLKAENEAIGDILRDKEDDSAFTKWIGKRTLQRRAENLKEQIEKTRISFNDDHHQFIENWAYQIGEKELLEGLLGKQKDDILDNYAELKYSVSNLERKIGELSFPYALFLVTLVSIFIVAMALRLFIRTMLRKREIEEKEQQAIDDVIRPIDDDEEDNRQVYAIGLNDVREYAKDDYYAVDMNTMFDDTAIQTVYISRKCIKDIYKFFTDFQATSKTNETGCFVVGRWEYASDKHPLTYNITLEEIVKPGNDAVYGEYTLDFGTEIGIGLESMIFTLRERTGKDYMQTCWIHTHPGLGLFLSNHDLTVQSQLAYPDHPNRMLAIVIDTHTENMSMAFFSPKKDGTMNNKDELKKELSLEEVYQKHWVR
jgi:hypothetical protein